jgi:tetratricopeptide (TPR) repeat protein
VALATLLAVAVLLATPAGAGQGRPGSLNRYLELVEAYELGAQGAALGELLTWEPGHSAEAARRLLETWERTPPADAIFPRLAPAAALLHTELGVVAADSGDAAEHYRQLLALRRLARHLHDRQRGGGDGGVIPARDLYLAAAAAQLSVGGVPHANILLVEYVGTELGLGVALHDDLEFAEWDPVRMRLPETVQAGELAALHLEEAGDAEMLLLAGCAQEALGVMFQHSTLPNRGPRARHALRRAETFFRRARSVAPESVEARLRLGGLLIRRGRSKEARALLEAVAERSEGSARGYVAWLLLGDLMEQGGEPDAARAAFERAVELEPHGLAARLALARSREPVHGYDAARETLLPLLAAGPRPEPGPWTLHSTGPEELRLRPLERLRTRMRNR